MQYDKIEEGKKTGEGEHVIRLLIHFRELVCLFEKL